MFIITGGGSGIGKALAVALAERNKEVLIIGRRADLLQEVSQLSANIQYLCTDITTSTGREMLACFLEKQIIINALINNAGILEPIAAIKNINLSDWQSLMATNVEAPLFLTQLLYAKLFNGRVLNVGSGLAHFPAVGLSAYCTSKAALNMVTRSYQLESEGIAFANVMPGIVATPMQSILRETSNIDAESKQFYNQLKTNQKLVTTETVAAFLCWLLLDIPVAEYIAKEWDIYDKNHHQSWLKYPNTVPEWRM